MSGKKKRVAVVLSESEEEVPLSTLTRNKGKGRARSPIFQSAMSPDPTEGSEAGDELFESNEGFEINEVYESNEAGGPDQWEDANDPNEDEYDRAFDTLNYAELDSIPTLQSSPRDNFVPVRSHDQPTSSRSPACSPSNHTYREPLTGLLDKEDSLVLVSMMDQRDQDFYRNHWRRADRGEGVGFEDLEVIGNKRKREAYPKRGGFRGRGRGRGGARARGRGKKR